MKKKKSPYEKEWERLRKEEARYAHKAQETPDSALNRWLSEKVPAGLQEKLDAAFAKAFALVFEKGTGVIEKSYNRDEREKRFQIAEFTARLRGDRKSLRRFSDTAGKSRSLNLALSGTAGVGMGLLGVGLPDIPVFTALLLKNLYEIAMSYGFDYKEEQERDFQLRLIHAALCHGDAFRQADAELNAFLTEGTYPTAQSRESLIRQAAGALSKELLYMKFLQGIPLVGVVGGLYDAVYLGKIGRYAELKYRRRFYQRMEK